MSRRHQPQLVVLQEEELARPGTASLDEQLQRHIRALARPAAILERGARAHARRILDLSHDLLREITGPPRLHGRRCEALETTQSSYQGRVVRGAEPRLGVRQVLSIDLILPVL